MVKSKHSLTDDHCFQLDAASLENRESHSDDNGQLHVFYVTLVPPSIVSGKYSSASTSKCTFVQYLEEMYLVTFYHCRTC